MFIGEKVLYTPQIITVTNDTPMQATVIAANAKTGDLTLLLPGGDKVTVDQSLCVPLEIKVDGTENSQV